jgi:hypothetical protein
MESEQSNPGFHATWRNEQEEEVKQRAKPRLPSQLLIEAIEAFNVVMAQAVERVKMQEQQLAQAQQAADLLSDRLRALEMENARLRALLERWALWTPVATDDQGNFCALCGGEEDPTESPDTFKHTERCPVRPTRAFLAEHPGQEDQADGE